MLLYAKLGYALAILFFAKLGQRVAVSIVSLLIGRLRFGHASLCYLWVSATLFAMLRCAMLA